MKRACLTALALFAAAVAGCDGRDDERAALDTIRYSADTMVRERTVEDTVIISQDTIIRTDTIVRPAGGSGARPNP